MAIDHVLVSRQLSAISTSTYSVFDSDHLALVARLAARGPAALDRPFADDWHAATDDDGRLRVVIDQVASLTDASAVALHERLVACRV